MGTRTVLLAWSPLTSEERVARVVRVSSSALMLQRLMLPSCPLPSCGAASCTLCLLCCVLLR